MAPSATGKPSSLYKRRMSCEKKGILGTHYPKALLNAVFFYNGKNFFLRGVQEHYNLTFAQLIWQSNPDRYTYYEFVSKNHQGGIADGREGKVVTIVHSEMARSSFNFRSLSLQGSSCSKTNKWQLLSSPFAIHSNRKLTKVFIRQPRT